MVTRLQGGRPRNWVSILGGCKKLCYSSKRAAQTTPYSIGNAEFSPVTKRLERDWLLVPRLRVRRQASPLHNVLSRQSHGVYSTLHFSSLQIMLSVSWHVLLLLLLLLYNMYVSCHRHFFLVLLLNQRYYYYYYCYYYVYFLFCCQDCSLRALPKVWTRVVTL